MLLLCLMLLPAALAGRGDYCKEHTLSSNSTHMQYNKELIEAEYAVHNQFKAIHCCGKGYRSIEWFKDGVAYPWASGVSNLILYPEAANQTLYTQRAGRIDTGNYTCRMRNDTHHVDHTIALQVTEMPSDTPRPTVTPNDQYAELGSQVRFYCEAFVGRVNLPDAHSDIKWHRVGPEDEIIHKRTSRIYRLDEKDKMEDLGVEVYGHNFKEIQTKRESEDIVGAYLYIPRVLPEDYGQYVCTVRSNDVVHEMPVTLYFSAGSKSEEDVVKEVPWRGLVLAALLVGVMLLTALVLHSRCWPRIALAARRFRDTVPLSEKEYDVLVLSTAVDSELTRGALLQTLQLKYHYSTTHLELTTEPDTWYTQVMPRVESCRALVVVLSPAQHSRPSSYCCRSCRS